MMKAKNLRDQSVDELKATLVDESTELFQLTNELKQARKLEKPHLIKEKRKNIAKLKTVIREKQNV